MTELTKTNKWRVNRKDVKFSVCLVLKHSNFSIETKDKNMNKRVKIEIDGKWESTTRVLNTEKGGYRNEAVLKRRHRCLSSFNQTFTWRTWELLMGFCCVFLKVLEGERVGILREKSRWGFWDLFTDTNTEAVLKGNRAHWQ